MAPHSSTLAWKNPMDGGAWWAAVHGVAKSPARLSDFTFTFHFHALEKEMATHSSVLDWRIPGTGEPGGLPSMGSHRVGHDWSDLAVAATDSNEFGPRTFPETQTETLTIPTGQPTPSSASSPLQVGSQRLWGRACRGWSHGSHYSLGLFSQPLETILSG